MPGTATIGMPVELRNSSGSELGTTSAPLQSTVGGVSKQIQVNFTRPSDTTAYASGDVVCNSTSAPVIMTFTNCARVSGGTGILIGGALMSSANVATKLSGELWIFTATVSMDNDNAVFTPTDTEMATLVGVIPFTTWYVGDATSGAGGNAWSDASSISFPYTCATTSLYGILIARNAYVPVSAEVFTSTLRLLLD